MFYSLSFEVDTSSVFLVDKPLFRRRLWELRGIRVPELGMTEMLYQFCLVGSFFKNLII
jgi:hypothetical protein